ncbi:hypothetical protein ABZY05_38335 [Streptomyces canus]|uniref:hypothetical protein n=1 Tax=Streptomyces canus TaxID=58343 RepID=UPI0033A9B576
MFDKIRRRLLRTLLLSDSEGERGEAGEAVVDEDDQDRKWSCPPGEMVALERAAQRLHHSDDDLQG